MTQEAVPDETVPAQPAVRQPGAPKGLLQQMEELMAALNADLSQLDADLQPRDGRPASAGTTAGANAGATADVAVGATVDATAGATVGAAPDATVDATADATAGASADGGDAR
ncbi:hypothetical protein [Streptomyces sp. NPDC008001]|uniref:hypothetical protein n=1 Tax=Streptomyces sp. NPDC008001 TaxID=3364804 RepID=UPI0036E88962